MVDLKWTVKCSVKCMLGTKLFVIDMYYEL